MSRAKNNHFSSCLLIFPTQFSSLSVGIEFCQEQNNSWSFPFVCLHELNKGHRQSEECWVSLAEEEEEEEEEEEGEEEEEEEEGKEEK